MTIDPFLWPLLSFALVLGAIPVMAKMARYIGLVDHPDQRKQHDGQIPLIGGIVILPVFFAVCFFGGLMDVAQYGALLAATMTLLLMGVYDDRFHVEAKLKFAIQIFAAFIIMHFGDIRVLTLGDLFGLGHIELYFTEEIFTIFCIVLLVNAVNLMDGLDGLAGGKCAIMFGALLIASAHGGNLNAVWILSVLICAVLGFLFYNLRHPFREKASVFMGDAGALSLGLILSWFVIDLAQDGTQANLNSILSPISAAWIVGLAIMDALAQFIRRTLNGQHPFFADRGHFHHHLVDAGLSPGRASLVMFMLTGLFGVIAILPLYFQLHSAILSVLWVIILVFHVAISLKPQRYVSLISRLI